MVSEGWLELRLDEICSKKIVYGIVQAGEHVEDGVPYIKSSDVGREINTFGLSKTAPEIHRKFGRSSVHPGDIVFSLRGNTGSTSIVPDDLPEANLTQGTARLTISPEYDTRFVRFMLGSSSIMRQVLAVAKGSTFTEVSLEALRKITLAAPPLPEQQKIAEILGTWDKAIETTEALLANARTQKRALMQSLLSGTRRFPGFEDHPWREVRLGDVVAGIPGGGTPDKGNPSFWGGDLPWVSVKDLKSTILTQTQDTITEAGLSSSATNAFPVGTIVMATRMAVGSCAILGSRMAINQDLKAIIPNDLIQNRYLFHCLQMSQDALAALGTGSTVKGITLDVLRELRIGLPVNKEEQAQISDAIDCADNEVSALQSDLDHLRTEKKSLMQQLLTGKRRVAG